MTPREKAEQLYNNYLTTIKFTMEDCSFTYRGDDYELCVRKTAKWSVLIAVDLLLSEMYADDYYKEVKHEIEKI